jgi:ABC-type Mn2+/Zn2+ transport system ATPase subunit
MTFTHCDQPALDPPLAAFEEPARLDLDRVSVAYGGRPALTDVSFQVPHGECVAVVGPNGAGKSTLFKALVGLLPLSAGTILIHGRPLGHHRDCVAYVPQREDVDWSFPLTVSDVVVMGRYGRKGWLRGPTAHDREIVHEALRRMGIDALAERSIGELSGGQQQRVFVARALAQEPHILLMDEPFTGVDVTSREAILQVLDQLHQQQVTAMISTHDLNLAATRFEQVLVLNRRLIAYGSPAEVFTPDVLRTAFGGQALVLREGLVAIDQCCPPEQGGVH